MRVVVSIGVQSEYYGGQPSADRARDGGSPCDKHYLSEVGNSCETCLKIQGQADSEVQGVDRPKVYKKDSYVEGHQCRLKNHWVTFRKFVAILRGRFRQLMETRPCGRNSKVIIMMTKGTPFW